MLASFPMRHVMPSHQAHAEIHNVLSTGFRQPTTATSTKVNPLFLFLFRWALDLGSTTQSLGSVLPLLAWTEEKLVSTAFLAC